MSEVLLPFKSKLSPNSNSMLGAQCSECHTPIKNLPISDACKICNIPICVRCGCYTSSFDIYCNIHASNIFKKAKRIGENHYYSVDNNNDFFTSKSFK